MDFNDTPEEAAYRKKVSEWLDKNATKKADAKGMELPRDLDELIAQSKAWQAKKADAGYACITWPKEWGG
ncbi:MAG: acyl-CoA dehydrogenase, partial [Parasphingorhabdus sp.]